MRYALPVLFALLLISGLDRPAAAADLQESGADGLCRHPRSGYPRVPESVRRRPILVEYATSPIRRMIGDPL